MKSSLEPGKGRYAGYLQMEGEQYLIDQLAGGRGGIFVTGHCGNWELMAAYAARKYPLSVVVRPLYDPRIDRLLNAHRERFGYHPIPRDRPMAVRDMLRVFRRNELLGILIDQDTKVRGVFVPFFGHLAHTPSGLAAIAYQVAMDANVAFMHRRAEGGHTLVISKPIPRPQTGDRDADILNYTAILTRELEDYIRQYPDEWVWMHRRWKKRPEGEPPEKNPVPL